MQTRTSVEYPLRSMFLYSFVRTIIRFARLEIALRASAGQAAYRVLQSLM